MKEDYLWDKTGEDAEIEQLEIALQAFRYRETKPPALPANVVAFRKKTQPKTFVYALAAAAACLAFVVISLGFWAQIFKTSGNHEKSLAVTNSSIITDSQESQPPAERPATDPARDIVNYSKPIAPQKTARAGMVSDIKIKRKTFRSSKSRPSPAKENLDLTEEEKYAYRQLMLALSITSSKLKIVRDKIQGNEEQQSVVNEKAR